MTFFLTTAFLLLAVGVLTGLVRRSLVERPIARKYRATFVAVASDLVGKPEFPDRHAEHLVALSAVRSGWLTRIMVGMTFLNMMKGLLYYRRRDEKSVSADRPQLSEVPQELRTKYVVALLSLAIADSYYSLLLGPVWRGMNSWVADALQGVKQDVNAHATQTVIKQVWNVPDSVPHLKSIVNQHCAT